MPVLFTVGELKNFIKDLPDDMELMGVDVAGEDVTVMVYTRTREEMSKEELEYFPDFKYRMTINLDK
jgi:hypothetical protein